MLFQDHVDGDAFGKMAGIVEADIVIEDLDLRLDRIVEVVAVDERVG